MNRLSLVCRTNFTCTILHTHCQFCNMFWHTKVPSSGSLRNCYRNTVKWSVVWLWLISRAINGITNPKHYLFHYLLCEHNSWFASFLFTPTFFSGTQPGRKTRTGCTSCLTLRRYSVRRQWASLLFIHNTFDRISEVLYKHEHADSRHTAHGSPYG